MKALIQQIAKRGESTFLTGNDVNKLSILSQQVGVMISYGAYFNKISNNQVLYIDFCEDAKLMYFPKTIQRIPISPEKPAEAILRYLVLLIETKKPDAIFVDSIDRIKNNRDEIIQLAKGIKKLIHNTSIAAVLMMSYEDKKKNFFHELISNICDNQIDLREGEDEKTWMTLWKTGNMDELDKNVALLEVVTKENQTPIMRTVQECMMDLTEMT